uniref:DNA-directed RNA polymerase III subunit RPC8 n=1 Tax=Crassostrea virginica TaxID=6565 RepID=A0A8B8CCT7_CRAVI|nr:DNA-directed RNA polymerase III subunit RPC8-like [Crassostrea virginica]XP_022312969.1 DNA-directed RNA polymerase III subunit RPC8-like [Crassostrea virginica]XP_022312970.1 DNA-directed RNA polymerase III subunit RPC8-like [Crassostrea virginica]XP_022312971.1 DNA-directed RNA polymerase III subunit RPC8-like [Crassostrea virginica]
MFVLSQMKDTVRIPPWLFHLNFNDAVIEALNKKLANKVVHNVGLCIALWDVTKLDDSYIFPGDGASHTIVHFRYVVFRPFMDEILTGKTKSCSKEGVYVSIGIFDDILIPADAMQHPSRFDDKEQLWAWEYETDDGKHDLFMDIGEEIRFRVVDEIFVDTTPSGPDGTANQSSEVTDTETKKTPYTIVGSISEPGLGLLSWWDS